MILSASEMKNVEAEAFARGVSAESLMNEAGAQIAGAVRQFFPKPGHATVYFGKGHNGGDALVAAAHLRARGWTVRLRPVFEEDDLSELTQKKLRDFHAGSRGVESAGTFPPAEPFVILDGLLGLGATGPLREPIRAATQEINRARKNANAQVFALDLPTGLDADTSAADPDCVVADFTLTIGFAKSGLLASDATNFVGRLAVLALDELSADAPATAQLATAQNLASLLPRRKFDSHKGDFGRVGIVAGSVGTTGAALMTAEAALRAGSGLITLYSTSEVYPLLASAARPEIMIRPVDCYTDVLKEKLDVLAVGPGVGRKYDDDILQLIARAPQPMVIDADALNALSTNVALLARCAGPRLLTPHPGEMARLFSTKGKSRVEIVAEFTEKYPVTLLLKGARTLVGARGQPLSYNSTGHPGMATGGMGDVLTGICAALLAQNLAPFDAARLGAWLHGRAAEIAIFENLHSAESLAATDLFPTLGRAFRQLCSGCF